ncbi:CD3337/EF1877 family mobilome membrane protein [Ectobacillus funiculus]|uniref:CD3337/EF1877 family mobilome membrane protein n=1 Tax=Ectobacillus funiculus TaxID=137993 RepID=A0ABV5WAH0_9BACI
MIKRVITIVMILIVSCTVLVPLNKTYAETPEEDKVERVKENIVYEGRVIKEQERFPISHYALETYFPQDFSSFITLGYSQSGQQMMKGMADMIWFANKSLAQFFIYAVGEMMSYDFISQVSEPVGLTLEKISGVNTENGVFSSFLTLIVAIMIGSLVIMYYVQNNTSGAVRAFISSLLILVGCYWFYGDASNHLKSINAISAEIENTISGWTVNFSSEADKTGDKPYTSKESQTLLQNQLFNMMIKKPYLNMMYGTSDEAKITEGNDNVDRITKLLDLGTWDVESQKARNTIVRDEVDKMHNPNMNILTLPHRVGYAILYFIATLFLGIPFMMLAASKIVLQIIFIVMLLISPALFLFSLIPNFQDTAGHTVKKLLGLIVAKAGIVFLVTISIGITTLLYETSQVADGFAGHAFLVFMECVMLFSIFKYRKEMFTIVSSARTHAENATDRVAYVAANKVEQAKDLSEKGIGHAIQRIKNKQSNAREQNQGAKGTQAQGAANPAAASSHSAKSSDKRESPSGTASSSTVASTAPVKQSSVRDNQKNEHSQSRNPVNRSEDRSEERQLHNIDPNKPITKWEAQQQIDKRNKPSTPSQYRESPAREKRWIQVDELQSSQREAQSENTMKANDEK